MCFFWSFCWKKWSWKERKKESKNTVHFYEESSLFFSKEGRRPTVYRHVSIHTQIAFFKCAKVGLSPRRTKKKKRDDASRRRRPRRLSSSRVSRGGPLRRQERRGRGEKKSFFVFCFFSPFSYFLCLPGGKKYDDARRRPKKSKKVKEESAVPPKPRRPRRTSAPRTKRPERRKGQRSANRRRRRRPKARWSPSRAREGKTEKRADPQPKRFCLWDDFLTVLWAPSSLLDKTARRASWSTRWDGKKSASNASKTRGIAR